MLAVALVADLNFRGTSSRPIGFTEFQDEIRRLQEMTGTPSRRDQMSLLPDDKKKRS